MGNNIIAFDWLLTLYIAYQDSCATFDGPRNALHLEAISNLAGMLGVQMDDLDFAYREYRRNLCQQLGYIISHPGPVAFAHISRAEEASASQ